MGDWWQLFPCSHSCKFNGALRIYCSPLPCACACLVRRRNVCRNWSHTWKSHLTLVTQIAVGYIGWCQAKTGQIIVLWPSLRSFYKYGPVSWLTNPLMALRDVLMSVWECAKCWVLVPTDVSGEVRKRQWGGRGRVERMSVISILASAMEEWHNSSVLAHHCHVRLATLLCVCCSSIEDPETFHWERQASCASLLDCPRRMVNTGNTKLLNASLLCLEDCHDNT